MARRAQVFDQTVTRSVFDRIASLMRPTAVVGAALLLGALGLAAYIGRKPIARTAGAAAVVAASMILEARSNVRRAERRALHWTGPAPTHSSQSWREALAESSPASASRTTRPQPAYVSANSVPPARSRFSSRGYQGTGLLGGGLTAVATR